MDDHDPLCPAPLCDFGNPDAECIDPYECDHRCDCALIARVREDERAAALRDAAEAIPHAAFCLAHGMSNANDYDCDCERTEAVAAIEALGKEKSSHTNVSGDTSLGFGGDR